MSLYFIALAPENKLKQAVRTLKEEMAAKYDVKHALRLPAHVTLQPPFKLKDEEEPGLIGLLEDFSKEQAPFYVELRGFGSFPPRVIYIKIPDPTRITKLYRRLQKELEHIVPPKLREDPSRFHPHITIATRDLDKKTFRDAWPQFENRHFKDEFTAKRMLLFRHNGKTWDVQREFLFQGEEKEDK